MFLLDTDVVSELRKVRSGKADAHVARWADAVDAASLYISAITVLELELGVLLLERRDARQGEIVTASTPAWVGCSRATGVTTRLQARPARATRAAAPEVTIR